MKITVEANIKAPIELVWADWNDPRAVEQWNTPSPEWHTPRASIDLREGGKFSTRMEARDGSMGFDFEGVYSRIELHRVIEYGMADGRQVLVEFIAGPDAVTVRETFDAENVYPAEHQRQGWQAILDSFARHVENHA
ncbi:SRPBCC domain-containing protein [Ottowia thiooxydans]|uniref:SRPBCC domain-containing protein n=1 Tax=Ottowia thiooxydans TaxID=219182 RepID=UPI0004038671|nr:SRPBCC domain-containing protein [Ottowia thiooxydans]